MARRLLLPLALLLTLAIPPARGMCVLSPMEGCEPQAGGTWHCCYTDSSCQTTCRWYTCGPWGSGCYPLIKF